MKILIAEDAACMALSFKQVLSAEGHEILWIVGVQNLEPFVAFARDKTASAVDLDSIDLALVDGQLFGPIEGPAIVEVLHGHGIPCVGISSQAGYNTKMREAGAQLALNKVAALGAVFTKTLTVQEAVSPSEETRARLTELETSIFQNTQLRRQLDALVVPFLHEED